MALLHPYIGHWHDYSDIPKHLYTAVKLAEGRIGSSTDILQSRQRLACYTSVHCMGCGMLDVGVALSRLTFQYRSYQALDAQACPYNE